MTPSPSALPVGASREVLARDALRRALTARRRLGISIGDAICVYDAIERFGIEVRFEPIPSMEGMYIKQTLHGAAPHILVSSLRPAGRQAMTAAHELGHHIYNHGTRIDRYVAGIGTVGLAGEPSEVPSRSATSFDREEFLADAFGSFFLMPKSAVDHGFAARQIIPSDATPTDFMKVAGWLGVGYSTLIYHASSRLKLLSWARAQQLLASKPKALRGQLLGEVAEGDVYVVDGAWTGRALDLTVGDLAIVPGGSEVVGGQREASNATTTLPGEIRQTNSGVTVFAALRSGIAQLSAPDWTKFVRVSAKEFHGRSLFRHLPLEPGDEAEDDR